MQLKCSLYEIRYTNGDGPLSPAEWGDDRRRGDLALLYQAPSDDNYQRIVNARADKTIVAKEVARILGRSFAISQCRAIGELGGAPYIQAYEFKEIFPHINYLATDQDIESNAVLAQVPSLNSLCIKTFNVTTDELSLFDACDILISHAVDYALEDADLQKIFAYISRTKKSWAIVSVSCISSLGYLRKLAGYLLRIHSRVEQRQHGWARSLDYLRALARPYGIEVQYKGTICGYTLLIAGQNI